MCEANWKTFEAQQSELNCYLFIAGAMEKKDYLKAIEEAGFKEVKVVSESSYEFDVSKDFKGKVTSIKVKAHKL